MTYSRGNGRREGVADLPVDRRLSATELPPGVEALDPSDHLVRQARNVIHRVLAIGRGVGYTASINAKLEPASAGAGWSEIGAAVLLGTANNRGSNAIGVGCPTVCAGPTVPCHEPTERLPDSGRSVQCAWPLEVRAATAANRHEDEARAKLRNAVL